MVVINVVWRIAASTKSRLRTLARPQMTAPHLLKGLSHAIQEALAPIVVISDSFGSMLCGYL